MRSLQEAVLTERFLDSPNEDSFADLFNILTPKIIAFFRARGCDVASAEDLAQEVMLIVHRKAAQVRDRTLFRAWMFKVARRVLSRYYAKQARHVETVEFSDSTDRLSAVSHRAAGPSPFEFHDWMTLLDSREREVLTLRYIEQWEYHEIAAARDIPIGTVQWRVFNAKKKLAPHLATRQINGRKAA